MAKSRYGRLSEVLVWPPTARQIRHCGRRDGFPRLGRVRCSARPVRTEASPSIAKRLELNGRHTMSNISLPLMKMNDFNHLSFSPLAPVKLLHHVMPFPSRVAPPESAPPAPSYCSCYNRHSQHAPTHSRLFGLQLNVNQVHKHYPFFPAKFEKLRP